MRPTAFFTAFFEGSAGNRRAAGPLVPRLRGPAGYPHMQTG